MWDIVRDSTFGQLVNWASSGRYASYPEQRPDFRPSKRFLARPLDSPTSEAPPEVSTSRTQARRAETEARQVTSDPSTEEAGLYPVHPKPAPSMMEAALMKTRSRATTHRESEGGTQRPPRISEEEKPYPGLVDWEENDQDNPQNWSKPKRYFVGAQISLLTFAVYVASAIYTSSIPGIVEDFQVSSVVATLGLTLFVFGYGISPMILSPMQEMPSVGRNPPYIIGLFLFVLFNMPPPVAGDNLVVLFVFRFASGFVGGPALATGGASMTDVFPPRQQAMAVASWAIGAACGPPLGGYPAFLNGWRWPFYEIVWLSGATFILLFFLLPETYAATILLRRAQRLRRATGNSHIKTRCEVQMTDQVRFFDLLLVNAKRAVRLSFEPAIFVANIHIALVYAILYIFFESFPLVFTGVHDFNLGETGLAFLCFAVPAPFTYYAYYLYQRHVMEPRMVNPKPGRPFTAEMRLEIGIFAGLLIPVALLIFGWTGRNKSVHWIWPMLGAGIYLPGIYLSFQSILMYIGIAYPAYAASIFAGNDFFRSCFAAPFPLAGDAFFRALGLGGGNTFLAGASLFTTGFLYLIYRYGSKLRERSDFSG
ncbi:hypothetical protein JCM11641_001326 [Rhodosporidiobolus odoratus]